MNRKGKRVSIKWYLDCDDLHTTVRQKETVQKLQGKGSVRETSKPGEGWHLKSRSWAVSPARFASSHLATLASHLAWSQAGRVPLCILVGNTKLGFKRGFYPLTCWSQCIEMVSLFIEKVIIQEAPILRAFITEVAECKNQQNESNNVSQQQEPNRLQQELHWNSWCNQATQAKEATSTSLIFQFSTHHTYRWAAWDLCYQNHLGESGLNRFVWRSRKCQCGGNQV